jgi:hypothetical protein
MCAALLCAATMSSAWAADGEGALEVPLPRHTFLVGDELRWKTAELVPRGPLGSFGLIARNIAFDLAAMPAGVTNASAHDVGAALAIGGFTWALMAGPLPVDAQLQLEARRVFGHRDTRFRLWTPLFDSLLFASIAVASFGTFFAGFLVKQSEWVEVTALMLEAFAVGQFFHLVPKLLLGREGPKDADGLGVIWGPRRGFELFPAGTPSGHAITLYALMGVLSTYYDNPWLTVGLQLLGFGFCATMFVDDYHFVSDLVWGAAMGWAIGDWVVRNRSSRFASRPGGPMRLQPIVEPRSGTVALLWSTRF